MMTHGRANPEDSADDFPDCVLPPIHRKFSSLSDKIKSFMRYFAIDDFYMFCDVDFAQVY